MTTITANKKSAMTDFYVGELDKATRIPDPSYRKQAVADILDKAMKHGIQVPDGLREKALSVLIAEIERGQGAAFADPVIRSMQVGQTEALMMHCGLSGRKASEVISSAWSAVTGTKINTRTDAMSNAGNIRHDDSLDATQGRLACRPTGDILVDAGFFSEEIKRAVIKYAIDHQARLKINTKKIRQFLG